MGTAAVLAAVCGTSMARVSGRAAGASVQSDPLAQSGVGGGLMEAVEAVAARSSDPDRTRGTLLMRLRGAPACYASDLTQEQYERILQETGLWPPTMPMPTGGISPRFFTDSLVWTGSGQTGGSGLAVRASLTYSFPDDGTPWGLSNTPYTGGNVLGAKLTTSFGTLDRGREYVRAAIAAWRRSAGLTYAEVADDNSAMDMSSVHVSTRGDIRIGGFDFAATTNGTLAYNAFPTNLSASNLGGGDMAINTSYFISNAFGLATADYLYLRNTCAHEHGHGLGYIHTIPCTQTKLMEPMISISGPITLSRDEVRAAARNYGDRFAGNQVRALAADLGNLTTPILKSVVLKDLSTNVGGGNFTDEDYFRFTIDSQQDVTITVTPTGDVASQGQQIGLGCSGNESVIDALACGNLNLQLLSDAGVLVSSAPAQPAGNAETVTLSGLSAGTYVVFVDNATSNAAASPNQFVQTYELAVRVGPGGGAFAPPDAIAGLNKRVRAGTSAFFNGSANSRATDNGATLTNASYDWDLDGDGLFETNDTPQPTFTYVSNGTYPVTLRLTDSHGAAATDTINVTVFGATTGIASVSPLSGQPGQTVPVTIFGANLKGVTNASQITVSGTGVTVTGMPSVNLAGTQITGLSFAVGAGAVQTARDVSVSNADGLGGAGTGVGVFTVGQPGQAPANDECAGAVSWGNALGVLPFNNGNATTGAQQSFPSTGCPAAGPILNDVWYSWTSPNRGTLSVNTDSQNAGFSTRVAMYRFVSTCPGTLVRCDDFGTAFTIPILLGTQYLFQVGSTTAGATGAANVLLSLAPSPGACCTNGVCAALSEGACLAGGGEWTFQALCSPDFCPQVTGACCITGSCFINTAADCAALGVGASWRGAATVCGTAGNPTTCCPANFNQVGGLTVQDLFDFLSAWFTQAPSADFNSDQTVSLQDLFDYLTAYFTGCAG
jgi:PKD repeat protein